MGIRSVRVDGQLTPGRAGLRSAWTVIYEGCGMRVVRNAVRSVRNRWRAFRFTRHLYTEACRTDVAVPAAPSSLYARDLTEYLLQRSLPLKLHALVQLRVVSQIASIPEITAKAEACRRGGWSDDQIKTVMANRLEEAFTEPELLALRYADEITRTPIDVDPLTVRELRRYFSPADLMELTACIAYENFRCRFANANSRVR